MYISTICRDQESGRASLILSRVKNRPARNRALMDETSFQPHGAILLPPYIPSVLLPRSILPSCREFFSVHVETTPITSCSPRLACYEPTTSASSLSLSLSLMRFRVFSLAIATGYIRRGKNTRRKRLTSFSREIGILRTVIERHLEGAEGNSNNRFSVETRGFLLGDARKYIARSCVLIRSLLSFSRLTLPKR